MMWRFRDGYTEPVRTGIIQSAEQKCIKRIHMVVNGHLEVFD